jgi:hypothetical protein
MVEDELGRLGSAQVSGGISRKSVEQENTGGGCGVYRQFAKSLPGSVRQGISGPSNGVGGNGIKSVGFGQIAGGLLVVPSDENGAQVRQELQTRERLGPVTHGVTEMPDGVGTLRLHVGDDRFEGGKVCVNVR